MYVALWVVVAMLVTVEVDGKQQVERRCVTGCQKVRNAERKRINNKLVHCDKLSTEVKRLFGEDRAFERLRST